MNVITGEKILSKVTTLQPRLFAPDSVFQLSKVNLVAAACPITLETTLPNQAQGLPIVIAKNRLDHGQLPSIQYAPKGVIVCGMQTRDRMMKQGYLHAWAWVENGVFEKPLQALDDKAVATGIRSAIIQASGRVSASVMGIPTAIVVSLFDGQVQYQIGAQIYRTGFELNCSSEFVRLTGASTPCF